MRAALIGLITTVLMAFPALSEPADIEAVIDRQLLALSADDFEEAFTFASPGLQQLFQSPENFQRMVVTGYPMVWRFSEVRFLELREEGGAFWQKVMITDQNGVVHLLDYRMLETADGWRINGVQILDSAQMNV
ncbi:DUF4864 domain-containing protein [Roseobacter sp.]|uniref:DUF4864 domain-containing protein n=1 Tax=Roseobacter sp. TaxID=1907202 RepID=UPI0025EE6305|nr:DUF4864 domain-containing protein [Roseobacter sp.]